VDIETVHSSETKESPMSIRSSVLVILSGLGGALLVATVVSARTSDSRAAFQGVWRTVEVVVPGPTPQTFKPGATLAIFYGSHYSRVEVHADGPRPVLDNPAAASADQLRAVWGPFVGEAGTFDVTADNLVTMHAVVAKNPATMSSGAASVYTYERKADTLTLTQMRTPSGASASPVKVTLMRVE
jgi:hypothetical protein